MTKETKEWVKSALDLCKEADEAGATILLLHPLEDKAGQVTLFGDIVVTNLEGSGIAIEHMVKIIQQPIPQSTQE